MTKSMEHANLVFESFKAHRPLYKKAKESGNGRAMKIIARFSAFSIWDIKGKNLCTGYCSRSIYETVKQGFANGERWSRIPKTPEHWNSRQSLCEDLFELDYSEDIDFDRFMDELGKGHSYHYVTSEENASLTRKEAKNMRGHEKYRAVGLEMGRYTLSKNGTYHDGITWEPVSHDQLIEEFGA